MASPPTLPARRAGGVDRDARPLRRAERRPPRPWPSTCPRGRVLSEPDRRHPPPQHAGRRRAVPAARHRRRRRQRVHRRRAVRVLARRSSRSSCPASSCTPSQAARVKYLGVNLLGRPPCGSSPTSRPRASAIRPRCSPRSPSAATTPGCAPMPASSVRAPRTRQVALYYADGHQMHDFRTLQDHIAPKTNSDLLFKGAVQDHAQERVHRPDPIREEARGIGRLPDQSQPHAQRGCLGRERAEPRHRDQRREVQPRQHRRPDRRGAALLPREPRHPARRSPSAWSCSASSTRCSTQLPVGSLRRELRAAGRRQAAADVVVSGTVSARRVPLDRSRLGHGPSFRGRRSQRSPSCASATTCTPSATRAATPTSRSARARCCCDEQGTRVLEARQRVQPGHRRAVDAAGHPARCRSSSLAWSTATWRSPSRRRAQNERARQGRTQHRHASQGHGGRIVSTLEINGLVASVAGKQILNGIDLTVRSGEVHAVMGPNGAGKSTLSAVVMGKPGYEVHAGEVSLDGVDLLGDADLAARAGRPAPGDAVSERGAGCRSDRRCSPRPHRPWPFRRRTRRRRRGRGRPHQLRRRHCCTVR